MRKLVKNMFKTLSLIQFLSCHIVFKFFLITGGEKPKVGPSKQTWDGEGLSEVTDFKNPMTSLRIPT